MSNEENTPQDQAKSIPTSASDVVKDDITNSASPAPQPEPNISNLESQITDMETHAHHLHKAPARGWRHYLFEFLMLFLAITLGFLVENLREHYVERKREKQYVRSLVQDLASDTVNLKSWITSYLTSSNDFDTLMAMLKYPEHYQGADIYFLARLATRARSFEPTNNTFEQLKYSGNFRLISNKKVAAKTISYKHTIESYKALNEIDTREAQLLHPLLGNVFDASVFNTMVKTVVDPSRNISEALSSGNRSQIERPAGNPTLRNRNADVINSLIYQLHQRKSSFLGEAWLLSTQKKQATELIELIKKEYHLRE